MARLLALFAVPTLVPALLAADPTPVEKQLTIQKAILAARQAIQADRPGEAVSALEAVIANADGNKALLTMLREAYAAELAHQEIAATPDSARIEQLRRHLSLLDGAAPQPVAAPTLPPPSFDPSSVVVPTPTGADTVANATAAFKKGDFATAMPLFAASAASLTAEQKAAWAYCRIWVANAKLADATSDASALAADVADALKLIPQNAELWKVGQRVIDKAKTHRDAIGTVVETASFRVHHSGQRALAERVAKSAESLRKEIFERWSGPPAGAWSVKCDIHIHSTSEAFAKATGRAVASTGNAIVRITDRQADERRIDLRVDDDALTANTLPRELTHVVLADLFPDKPAPKWAVEGMAILAGSPEEAERFTRTLRRCSRDGDWLTISQLLDLKDFPRDHVTAFYCESVALTEYLVRAAGNERNFTIFLRDCQRYGTSQALKRQFNIADPRSLEAALKQVAQDARQ